MTVMLKRKIVKGAYHVYDYNVTELKDKTWDYVVLLTDYMITVEDQKLYVMNYEGSPMNREGIALNNENYNRSRNI